MSPSSTPLSRFIGALDIEFSPTHFFDPDAAASANTGTFANPFVTVPAIQAYIDSSNGGQAMRLGLKRGTIFRGAFALQGISGSDDLPVFIGPYGDSLALPQVVGGMIKSDWVAVDGQAGMYQGIPAVSGGTSKETELYESGIRYIRIPQQGSLALAQSALLAAGAGHAAFFGGIHYIIPVDKPNLGQIEYASEDAAFSITLRDAADCGHLYIMGLHARLSRNFAFGVYPLGSAAGRTGTNIVIEACAAGQAGVDTTNPPDGNSGSMAAFSLGGSYMSAANRMTQITVRSNFAYQAINNALELLAVDGALVEMNQAREINGCSIVECFAACSNVVARYNRGYGDINAWSRAVNSAASSNSYQKAGFWQSSLTLDGAGGTAIDAGGTANANNVYAFNYVEDAPAYYAHVQGGSCKIHHNTFVRRHHTGGESFLRNDNGAPGGANACEFSNNLCVDMAYSTSQSMLYVDLYSNSVFPKGDRNIYSGPYSGSFFYDGSANGFLFTNYRAQPAVAAAPLDQTSYANRQYFPGAAGTGAIYHRQAQVDTLGRPTQGSIANGNGTTSAAVFNRDSRVDYSRDIEGKPMSLSAPTIGCYA